MSLLNLSDTIGDVKRFRTILSLIYEEGFAYLVDKARLRWGVSIECRIRCFLKSCVRMWQPRPTQDYYVKLRNLLIKLGPTFVKLGQVMSLRPDILPEDLCKELSKLTDNVPPITFGEVKSVVEKELKKPLPDVFAHFEEKPLAAASLAQVHKATLKNGKKVAVKVQRPDISELITKDIHIMLFLAGIIEDRMPEWKIYRPVAVVKEFAETIMRELDFTTEAIHAKRFATIFENEPNIKVAKVYSEATSRRVLTMELIEGIRVDNLGALKKAKIDKQILAQNGVNAFLRQVFVEGFFHADPHPGNYFALPGNIFAFIDYGMVGRLSVRDRREMASLFISFINQDSESAIDHIKHLVEITQNSNIPSFEHDVDDILHQWYGAKLREVSLAQTFFRIIESARGNQIYFPSSLVYLGKTLFTVEAMGFKLDPDFDFAEKMGLYVSEIIKFELNPKKLQQKVQDRALDYISYLEALPEKTFQLLEKIDKGEIGVKINQEELGALEKRISSEGFRRLGATIVIMLIVSLVVSFLVQRSLLNLHISVGTFSVIFLVIALFWFLRRG